MKSFLEALTSGSYPLKIQGVEGTGLAWILVAAARLHRRMVVICNNQNSAEALYSDVRFLSNSVPLFYPAWDTIPLEHVSPGLDITARRLHTLLSAREAEKFICITTPDAALQKVLPETQYSGLISKISTGDKLDYDRCVEQLFLSGYHRVQMVEKPGDCAIRGSVVDVFPGGAKLPVRIEFLDNEVESLRNFSTDTQRSIAAIDTVILYPVREAPPSQPAMNREWINSTVQGVKERGLALELPPREIGRVIHAIKNNRDIPGKELSLLGGAPLLVSPLTLFPDDTLFVIEDRLSCQNGAESFYEYLLEREEELLQAGYLFPETEKLYSSPDDFFSRLKKSPLVEVTSLSSSVAEADDTIKLKTGKNLSLTSTRLEGSARASLSTCIPWIQQKRQQGYDICFVIGTENRAVRLQELLLQSDLSASIFEGPIQEWYRRPRRPALSIIIGAITHGVQFTEEKICLVAEDELFPQKSYRRRKTRRTLKSTLSSLGQLVSGDIVVHEEYGIGRFQALVSMVVEDTPGDFVQVEYADSTLYLPVQNLGRLQRYVTADENTPRLDRLGSKRWARAQQKVRDTVITLAGDLLNLYAERSITEGWQYDPATAEDERFSDEFPYMATPDQQEAIDDVLADMTSTRPMDRLICGDVGFGKTEVAMRAAYKAVQHGRQVAVLVPTTILVEQHRNTFVERFAAFGVKIAAMSRFYSGSRNRKTREELADGSVDIVIGTHTLLSRSVHFKDLGLLIVDEEHRFGVKQKERLKQLKTQIDVLTLTATPIPRTLQMSLMQIRDVSVIATPPTDRRLIKTYVTDRNDTTIKDAVVRELRRGGQVYFVHNRVQTIDLVADGLRELIPEAKIEFAHGQMAEHQLEAIMHRFVEHDIDLLVCTAIIESGLDISNANTILIDRSDMFGLAQLYQLRGRVGRGNRQSYCYFLIPEARRLGKEAQRRLKALQGIDDLGQGFQLALRDLEIRGAGNLLGREQSGAMLSVGYEMYTKILEEAIGHLKGQPAPLTKRIDPEVKLNIPAFLPETYIPDVADRLIIYQRLAALESIEEAQELREEIIDRFGNPGRESDNLFDIMTLRAFLRTCGIEKLEAAIDRIIVTFHPDAEIDPDAVLSLIMSRPARYRLRGNLNIMVLVTGEPTPEEYLRIVQDLWYEVRKTR